MGNIIYLSGVVLLVIAWAIIFIGYHTGGFIHILLIVAFIAIIIRRIRLEILSKKTT